MRLKKHLSAIILLLLPLFINAQEDTLAIPPVPPPVEAMVEEQQPEQDYLDYDPLAPARAAFYSAILPGLGQAYNKKYWKIPIAYAGLGVGIYFYIDNDQKYDRYRSIYKRRLEGHRDDEFIRNDGVELVTNDGLIRAQRFYARNKEISLLVTVGIYALNIIDANVDAHLAQFNVSEDLSLRPSVNFDEFTGKTGYGLSLNLNF
ncbi:hypothetical protein FHG64_17145 [Antarcticibacterium flavum]|uniref:DUF5683 domain-containing protein n=1 Tax=Antarcticibacterium flavum TaxID=2058175 RepID=A0A5B7X7B2_9FLAO|nr:DUF5683 domain-containing protein [Antarcticibacterium flavum]MCM4159312.1 hypothetical protein [Antarcticibacterium sp. W02-3]QCY70980.1 hypothetical protein FHG64_17145 [Antarcticibacterium flavum]